MIETSKSKVGYLALGLALGGVLATGSAYGIDAMFVDTAGNVGVGTSSPAGAFDVNRGGPILMYLQSADNSVVQLRLKSDSVNRRVVASDASNAVKSQAIFGDGEIELAGANVGSALFATFNANGLVLSGSVGIGTSSPEVKLHVQTNEPGFPTSFMVDNQGSDFAGFKVRSTGGDIDLNNSGGNTFRIDIVWTATAGSLSFSPTATCGSKASCTRVGYPAAAAVTWCSLRATRSTPSRSMPPRCGPRATCRRWVPRRKTARRST